MTKYSRNTRWMKPYVEAVRDIVPLSRLQEVIGFKVPLDKSEQCSATIIRYTGAWYKITLRLWDPKYKNLGGRKFLKTQHKRSDFASVLDSLAHELAHMIHWDHTPEHLILQSKILIRLARVAKKLGVKDTYSSKIYKKISKEEEEQF